MVAPPGKNRGAPGTVPEKPGSREETPGKSLKIPKLAERPESSEFEDGKDVFEAETTEAEGTTEIRKLILFSLIDII